MKRFTFTILAVATLMVSACSNSGKMESSAEETPADSIPVTEAYACPMHPEITSDKPGTCSICGMALEKK